MMVSIIIPTFNRAEILARTVQSALEQTYTDTEVIVVDDGSSDNTLEVLKGFGRAITVIRQDNAGPSAARNRGAAVARGDVLAFLDSDDVWLPDKTERQMQLLSGLPSDIVCCISNASLQVSGREFSTSFELAGLHMRQHEGIWTNPDAVLATRFVLFNQVAAIRRDRFFKVGGYRPHLRILEDYDLAFRLALEGPWAFVADPLVIKYEDTHGIGVTANRNHRQRAAHWLQVLSSFLRLEMSSRVRRLVRRAYRQVVNEVHHLDLLEVNSAVSNYRGRLGLARLRAERALNRRMPSWPNPETRALPPNRHRPIMSAQENRDVVHESH